VRMPRQYVFAMVDGFGWGWVGAVVDLTRARSEVEAAGLRARRLRRRPRAVGPDLDHDSRLDSKRSEQVS